MKRVEWEVVKYKPEHRGEVLRLMELVQGHRTPEEEFVWWFEENPTKDLNIYLAVYEGKIIGVSCHNTFEMLISGKEQIVSFPLNVLTHPDFRGQGIFSKLEQVNEDHTRKAGFSTMLSFPNAASTPLFLNKLGWGRIKPQTLYMRPVRCGALARKSPYLSWASNILAWIDPFLERDIRLDREGISTEAADEFGDWADRIYEENRALLPNCIIRRKEYLNWRFMRDPGGRYSLFKVKEGDAVVGYFVLGKMIKKGLWMGYLANALLRPSHHIHFSKILDSFIGFHKAAGADLILGWESYFLPRTTLAYLPIPKRFNFIYKLHAGSPSKSAIEDNRNWFFQLGDLDFF